MGFAKGAAAVTAVFAAAAPFDPTGLSAVTCFVAGTVTCTAKAVKVGKKELDKAEARSLARGEQRRLSPQTVQKLRRCCRGLTGATVATVASVSMCLVMPAASVGVAIGATLMCYRGYQLHKLQQAAGGHRALFDTISKVDLAAQMTSGAALSSVVLVLCTGPEEFNTVMEGLSQFKDDPSVVFEGFHAPDKIPIADGFHEAIGVHDSLVHSGPLHESTAAADMLPNGIKGTLGVQGTPVWHDGIPFEYAVAVGAGAQVSEGVAQVLVQAPGRAIRGGGK
ncbi:Fc.00g011270.m01.CDS01 [Cosmosporella sp. VM-42]